MWNKIRKVLIAFVVGIGTVLLALLFGKASGRKASGGLKGAADKNRQDLREQLASDRERNRLSREELGRDRELSSAERRRIKSERSRLKSEGDIIEQSRDSIERTRRIIDDAGTATRRILEDS